MKRTLTLILSLFLFTGFAFAGGIIKGNITDKNSGEPLIGATISIKSKNTKFKLSTGSGLDGSFSFKNVPAGEYEIEGKYISFKEETKSINVKDAGITIVKIQLVAKGSELKEITIGGRASGETDQSAIRTLKQADQVMNVVSAKTIEVSPDITVANVMQRVSGVSIERSNNGEGQYAIIRGMEKRYTYTLINGFKIPSPDNKNRYIPLDIFPADIVSRLEVYKSLTPSMEGDAIAGGVNLVLKDAPDEFTVKANLGMGVSQSVINNGFTNFKANNVTVRSPRIINGSSYNAVLSDFSYDGQRFTNSKLPVGTIAGLSVGGRSADKKFGALVSLSYQNIYKDNKSVLFGSDVDANNSPQVTDITRRIYNIQQERTSAIGRFDYKFNKRNKLTLDADYINLAQNLYRFSSDTALTLARTAIGQGRVTQDPRSERDVQKIYNFTLHGEHSLTDILSFNYSGVYAKATANGNRYDLGLITSNTLQSDGSVLQAPTTIDASKGQTQTFSYNSDQDKSGYLNVVYTPKLFDTKVIFTAGGMYRNKTRSSTFDQYTLSLPSIIASTQIYDGNIDHNTFSVATLQGTASDPLNYDFTENVGAGFLQFKFNIDKLEAVGGARYEHTDQNYYDALPATSVGKTGSIKYYDILPSLNLKYTLSDKENLRAAYYSAISRPNFYELVPHTSGDPDADYQEKGNPNLKHTTADNYDLRYEFFPKALDQLLVGVFYKKIVNPIEYALVNQMAAGSGGFALQASNFGTAHNYGFEADITKYIHHFGFRANYSYTNSEITSSKAQQYRNATGNVVTRLVDQTRPLQGQSKNIGNLSLLYKDAKSGLDAQISAVYTGERINSVSTYLDNDIWQKGFVTLDVSAEKKVFKNLFIYAKATNLLNTPYELFVKLPYPPLGLPGSTGQAIEYQEAGKNTFIRKDNYQQYYILGLHYKL
ncbi:TonB-dependent receptor [Mucilaginibacter gracilis]|uniref:TonB-dependent receptor n=1 Tax=Mucilaginibacter gracilis TaxID=423350 RepID=A0A495J4H0_9SPHI|nr:TonB-dependent receptor [Mucilaginibacter gracilis]RKR83591.1 TonB-dependent receptor [Mucilaginibacter gracilis]